VRYVNINAPYKIGELLAAALRYRVPMRSQLVPVKEAQDNGFWAIPAERNAYAVNHS